MYLDRIGTNAIKQYKMITSGITIISTAEEECSTLPIYNILIHPRSADIETFSNELYTIGIFLIQNRSLKKYNRIFYQNPIHWAELTDSSQSSLYQQQKGRYKSIVRGWPKILESLKILIRPKTRRAADSIIFGHLPIYIILFVISKGYPYILTGVGQLRPMNWV